MRPNHQHSQYIAPIISPIAGKTSSHDLNLRGENELLASLDVSPLFTNVPIGEAVQVIQAKLREDDSLGERTPDREQIYRTCNLDLAMVYE